MAMSLMQKLRLAWRGWMRRRADQQQEFVTRSATWGKPVAPAVSPSAASGAAAALPTAASRAWLAEVDVEGLQVAFLDDSGQLAHWLDTTSGEIVDLRSSEPHPEVASPRFRRIPTRTDASEAEDRRAFVASLAPSSARDRLQASIDTPDFRAALAADRTIERSWFNFKNERALQVVRAWLRQQ